ncbi:MAG: alpha-ketoglutarate-dependent dioxygenase AlkB [Bacteroidota bacterium]
MSKLEEIPIPDGELWYHASFFSETDSNRFFTALKSDIDWRQEEILIFGKKIPQPRLVAWYGDSGISYTYSGLRLLATPWTPSLLQIKQKIESATGCRFNSVLLNLYRHGQDSMSWHSDDEPELGRNPVIASVSFGGIRRFHLRHKHKQDQARVRLDLAHGSLLIMKGETQHNWQHQISKTARNIAPRINLTFRWIEES